MTRNDDDAWFEALRGKPFPDSAPETVRHAEAIRSALLTQHEELAVTDAELARLKAKLHAEGLLEARSPSRRSWYAMAAGLALCTGAALIFGNQVMGPPEAPYEQLRGESGLQIVYVPHPADTAREIRQRLLELHVEARVLNRPNGVVIEANIPSHQELEVNQLLESYSAHVGPNGHLQLEFRSK